MKLFRNHKYVNLKDTLPTALKRLAAFWLLCMLLFNFVGYRFVAQFLQIRFDHQLEAALDHQLYDENDLTELKIPLNAAYQSSSLTYERANGEVSVDGVIYQYVKRKVFNDTLYVKCIVNKNKMHVEAAKNEFFRITNDVQGATAKGHHHQSKNFLKAKLITEFNQHSFLSIRHRHFALFPERATENNSQLSSPVIDGHDRPPESNLM